MGAKYSRSHLYVFELVLPLLFKGVCIKKRMKLCLCLVLSGREVTLIL